MRFKGSGSNVKNIIKSKLLEIDSKVVELFVSSKELINATSILLACVVSFGFVYLASGGLRDTLKNVATAFFVTVLLTLIAYIYQKAKESVVYTDLAQLLGLKNTEVENVFNSNKVVIVIPQFIHSEEEGKGAEGAHAGVHALKDRRLTTWSSLGFDDVVAAKEIIAMCVKLGLKTPKIESDIEIFKKEFADRGQERHKVYILIGLFSNEVFMSLNSKNEDNEKYKNNSGICFIVPPKEYIKPRGKRANSKRALAICSGKSGLADDFRKLFSSTPTDDYRAKMDEILSKHNADSLCINFDVGVNMDNPGIRDFGLFARFRTPGGNNCLILGGAISPGTREVASYLKKNYKKMVKEWELGTGCFAVGYDIDYREVPSEIDGLPAKKVLDNFEKSDPFFA